MLTLLIETSTERGIVAILNGTKLLSQIELPFGFNNSSYLLPTIDAQLKHHHLTIPDFKLIVVGVGPGSYTGIRVGAITAKTLSYACQIPLIGVCSLEGFVPDRDCAFAAMIDAKIGGVYLMKGVKKDGVTTFISEPQVCSLEKLDLKDVTEIVTPYSNVLKEKLHKIYPEANWEWEEKSPDAFQMVSSAIKKLNKDAPSDPNSLELMYLRKTQAEIEREARK